MIHINTASWEVVTLSNTLAARFRMGVSTVHDIIRETCDVIWDVLSPMELPEPKARDWKRIADDFYTSWNFPNCLGALDGKHLVMEAPPKSGSQFFLTTRELSQ